MIRINKLTILTLYLLSNYAYISPLALSDKTPRHFSIDAGYTIHRFFEVPQHPALPLDMESFLVHNQNELYLRVNSNKGSYDICFNIQPLVEKHFQNSAEAITAEIHYGLVEGYENEMPTVHLRYLDKKDNVDHIILPTKKRSPHTSAPKKIIHR